jgi:hypothetical protein
VFLFKINKPFVVMKIQYLKLCMPICLLVAFGCSKSITPRQCTAETTPVISSITEVVQYSVSVTTETESVKSISYQSANGLKTINDPVLPWALTDTIPKGRTIQISATGNVKDGQIKSSVTYSNGTMIVQTLCH